MDNKNFLIIVTVVLLAVLAIMLIKKKEAASYCEAVGLIAQRRTIYSEKAGCFVEVNNKFIPYDKWKGE